MQIHFNWSILHFFQFLTIIARSSFIFSISIFLFKAILSSLSNVWIFFKQSEWSTEKSPIDFRFVLIVFSENIDLLASFHHFCLIFDSFFCIIVTLNTDLMNWIQDRCTLNWRKCNFQVYACAAHIWLRAIRFERTNEI